MAKDFGKTWWGEHWLKALAEVDYGNRLPRGATYARKGMVQSLTINGNTIAAKVAGSRRTPYQVTINVPTFPVQKRQQLLQAIADRPLLIAKLLNRELGAELLPMAEAVGLSVFPKAWDDLDMHCSCPDWAVPCKHLASTIYMLSREIDNNPFLVFSMHDLDLMAELNRLGITIAEEHIQPVPTRAELYQSVACEALLDTAKTDIADIDAGKTDKSASDNPPQNFCQIPYQSHDQIIYQRFDFASLTSIVEPMVQLLPNNSPFYPKGSFKDKYLSHLNRVAKETQRLLKQGIIAHQTSLGTEGDKEALSLNHHSTLALGIDGDSAEITLLGQAHDLSNLNEVLVALMQINSDYLPDYQPSVVALHKLLFASLHLLASGSVVPQIYQCNQTEVKPPPKSRTRRGKQPTKKQTKKPIKKQEQSKQHYAIRWLPARLDKNAQQLLQQLDSALHPIASQALLVDLSTDGDKPHTFADPVSQLLSILVTTVLVHLAKPSEDHFEALFFNGKVQAFGGIGEQALASSIQAWLSRYFLSIQRFQPVIEVGETRQHQAFDISISINDTAHSDHLPTQVTDILHDSRYQATRIERLQPLSLLSSFIHGLDEYIAQGADKPMRLSNADFAEFLQHIIPALRLLSVQIVLPKSLNQLIRPKSSLRIGKKASASGTRFFGMNDLLEFQWQVALGEQVISPEHFEQLVENATGLLYYQGQYVYVDAGDLARLQKQLTANKPLHAGQLLQAALSETYEGAPVLLSDEARALIKTLASEGEIPLPSDLQATLRPYQQRGYAWMLKNSRLGFGSIIADDMGLGKTLQVIAVLLKLKEEGALTAKTPALIVVPTGLLSNWQAELDKFAPSLSHHCFHGSQREIKAFSADILLTTYGVLRSDVAQLKKIKWQVFAIDEAQAIKNANTAQSKAVKSIKANTRIAMSGTPVENRLSEFWSIMDFANKGYLGTAKQFDTSYAKPIQVANDAQIVGKFRRVTAPFMLRRMKTDKTIISDLPDKIEQNQLAILSDKQAALYETTVREALLNIESNNEGEFARQGMILQMILALKQICNHPANYLKNGYADPSLSGKTQLLMTLLDSMVQAGEKALIFTQFTEMGELLQQMIAERFGELPMFYHGGCSVKQRSEMVERFQHNRADNVFILSLKAAGTGLNLTAASHVIHFDLWWNPAVENQATDRAYRIGQQKNVMVHRLITQNTFEEKIDAMIQEKKRLAEMTVATGESWIGKLSNKALREIFG